MEQEKKGKQELLSGILEDARGEAERILNDAEEFAKERKETATIEIDRVNREAEQKIEEESHLIEAHNANATTSEIRRIRLRSLEDVIEEIMEKIEAEVSKRLSGTEAQEILKRWAAEAVIGLDQKEVTLSASSEERRHMDNAFIDDVRQEAERMTGRTFSLSLSDDDDPVRERGVLVTSKDGRTSFKNTISSRMMRYKSDMLRLIHRTLFEDSSSGPGKQ